MKLVVALQARPDLHAAGRQQVGRSARHADAAGATGGANWQGGCVRSRDEDVLHLHRTTRSTRARPRADRLPDAVGHARTCNGHGRAIRRRRAATRRTAAGTAGARGGRRAVAAGGGEGGGGLTVQGLPLIKPPYGRITAIDLNKGELVWQIAHGETPDNVKQPSGAQGLTIPRTGRHGPHRHARRPRRW